MTGFGASGRQRSTALGHHGPRWLGSLWWRGADGAGREGGARRGCLGQGMFGVSGPWCGSPGDWRGCFGARAGWLGAGGRQDGIRACFAHWPGKACLEAACRARLNLRSKDGRADRSSQISRHQISEKITHVRTRPT